MWGLFPIFPWQQEYYVARLRWKCPTSSVGQTHSRPVYYGLTSTIFFMPMIWMYAYSVWHWIQVPSVFPVLVIVSHISTFLFDYWGLGDERADLLFEGFGAVEGILAWDSGMMLQDTTNYWTWKNIFGKDIECWSKPISLPKRLLIPPAPEEGHGKEPIISDHIRSRQDCVQCILVRITNVFVGFFATGHWFDINCTCLLQRWPTFRNLCIFRL